jgi:hypothetical protein
MKTYTQLFYSKFCEYPTEALMSRKGEELIKKAAKIIEEKDGKEEAQYFLNLMTCSTTI